MPPPSDVNRPGDSALVRVGAVAMVVAPVLLLASTIAYVRGDGLNGDELGGTIQVFAMATFLLALFALVEVIGRTHRTAAGVLAVLVAIGVTGGITYGMDSVNVGLDNGTTLEEFEPAGILVLNLPGAIFPLAIIAAGLLAARAGVGPRWAGMVLALAGLLFPLSRIPANEPLAIAADCLFVVGLVPIGLALLRPRADRPSTSASAQTA